MAENKNHELKMYRIGFFFGAVMYPLFGYVYFDYYLPFDFDGYKERMWVGLVCLLFFLISYVDIQIKIIRFLGLLAAIIVTGQYFIFSHLSNYHFMHITGLIQLPIICIMIFYRKIDAIIYFICAIFLSTIILKNSPLEGITYPFLIGTYMLIYYVCLSNRENLMKDLNNKIIEVSHQKTQIEEKNASLIKIGELAAQVAHDIRSPVTALEAVSQMLGDDIDPKKKKLIENAARRVNDIANNLVSNYRDNLTKDLSTVKIDRSITLNSLIEDIVEEKKLSLDSKNRILLKAPESIGIPDNINATEFQRVISNLINNSIESFDKESGLLDVELSRSSGEIKIRIRDNGKGIPSDQLQTVFDKGISTKPKGAGLGLSHAKSYLQSVGGDISIESSSSAGTAVVISL